MKSITGQDLYSTKYKENIMKSYANFYKNTRVLR